MFSQYYMPSTLSRELQIDRIFAAQTRSNIGNKSKDTHTHTHAHTLRKQETRYIDTV